MMRLVAHVALILIYCIKGKRASIVCRVVMRAGIHCSNNGCAQFQLVVITRGQHDSRVIYVAVFAIQQSLHIVLRHIRPHTIAQGRLAFRPRHRGDAQCHHQRQEHCQ